MSKNKQKIILYSVPEAIEVGTGPTVRVTNFARAFRELGHHIIIKGKAVTKISLTLSSPKTELLYIESSTNRLKLVDLFCLLILKYKSDRSVVYIRDIYTELFPEEYKTLRSQITKLFNKLSIYFYAKIASQFAFPTLEMGNKFYQHNKILKRRAILELPPGSMAPDIFNNISMEMLTKERLKEIKIAYIGGVLYKFSGINNYLNLIKKYNKKYKFYIITRDSSIESLMSENGLSEKDVTLKSLNNDELLNFIYKENITFAIHSRPRNIYDDLTYPIKVMDFISWLLPFFTESHLPLVKMLGKTYPLYWHVSDLESFGDQINQQNHPQAYQRLLELLEIKREENLYTKRVKNLL